MAVGQGISLGTAQGKIIIDLSDLQNVRVVTQQVGQEAEKNLGRVSKASKGLSMDIKSLAAVFGITFGAAAVAQLGRFALQADAIATAYARQTVAARSLAGSQAQLNILLDAYAKATGGAIDKATALADVTRLQAVGFADSAEELTRFTTVARGISLAMGRTQDYVISQLQLAIANQSTMRLDQIGLGVTEVENRIKKLREENRGLTKEMAYQEAVLGIAEEKYGDLAKSAEAQATGAELATKAYKDLQLELGKSLGPGIGRGLTDLADTLEWLRTLVQGLTEDIKNLKKELPGGGEGGGLNIDSPAGFLFRGERGGLTVAEQNARTGKKPLFDLGVWLREQGIVNPKSGIGGILSDILPGLPNPGDIGDTRAEAINEALPGVQALKNKQAEAAAIEEEAQKTRDDIAIDHAENIRDIEQDAAKSREEATREYESQRTEVIRSYEQNIVRDAEDFARQRKRAEENLQESIAKVREDAAERDAEVVKDHEERVAEIRDDAAKRLVELEENYARDRAKALRGHQDRLQELASNLDARGIAEEERRFARETEDAEEAHDDQKDDLEEALKERLDEENKGHQERLEESRKADAERIQDMRKAFEKQTRLENEDRAIRLQRQAADHAADLEQMARDHQDRLTQISTQEAEARKREWDEFNKALQDQGMQNDAWYKERLKFEKDAIDSFDRLWKAINQKFGGGIDNLGQAGRTNPVVPTPFAVGGPVLNTGLALLHRGEYVVPAQRGKSVTRSVNVGTIVVNEANRPGQTAAEIRSMLLNLVTEAAA